MFMSKLGITVQKLYLVEICKNVRRFAETGRTPGSIKARDMSMVRKQWLTISRNLTESRKMTRAHRYKSCKKQVFGDSFADVCLTSVIELYVHHMPSHPLPVFFFFFFIFCKRRFDEVGRREYARRTH